MALAAKKVVLLLGLHDNDAREKRKVLKTVSTFPGLDLISIDMKASKLTVVGMVDPIELVTKLRKLWHAEILSVGPANKEDKAAAAAAAGGVKEEEGGMKREEVPAVLVESRPTEMRSWPHPVVYPAQHPYPYPYPYPYRPEQYVPGGLGARGEKENPRNNLYVAQGYGARKNNPSSYGGQDPNACAIC